MAMLTDTSNRRLLELILKQNRRFFAPVGGRTALIDGMAGAGSGKLAKLVENMAHHANYYEYDLVSATMPKEIIGDAVRGDLHDVMRNSDIKPYYACIGETKKKTDKLVGGACFSALTAASQIYGTETVCRMLLKKPLELHGTLAKINRIIFEFAVICRDAGADFFWIADPLGSIIREKDYIEFSRDYITPVFEYLDIPGCLHIPGKTNHIIDAMIQTGAQCLSLDSYCDMRILLHRIPENVCILGNINSLDMLFCDHEYIRSTSIELNEKIINFPNVIVGSGGGISSETPKRSILELKEITEQYPFIWTAEEFSLIRDILTDLRNNPSCINSAANKYLCHREIFEAALNEWEYEKSIYSF